MASGVLSLIEATKSGSDQLKRGVTETIIQENPWIELLPWQTFAGNALKQTVEDTLPSVSFRPVNGSYTKSYGTDTARYWGVSILGGEYGVDPFLVDVIGTDEDLEAKQIRKLSKANAMRFGYEAVNGDGTGDGFKGVKQLIDEGLGQKLANSATGATLSLDKLDQAFDLSPNSMTNVDAILANKTVRRQITSAARSTFSGISLIDIGTDVFGRKVTMYNDTPIRILGDVINGSNAIVESLPFTEDPGDATSDCCSIYLVKFGEDDVTGLLGKGGSFNVKRFADHPDQPQRWGRLEWYPGLAIFNPYAITRVTGITAS